METSGISLRRLKTFLINLKEIFAEKKHSHATSDITGLDNSLSSKATSAQGLKADTAVQSVKIGTTEYKSGTTVTLPSYPTTLPANGGNSSTVNGHTVNSDVPANAKFTDTTYSSKSAASGGTDVSLVTTGEKAVWNAKTSNIGTLTGIKMNGASKGTSGIVDLGTVLTGGSQTATSTADGGSNVYTFSDGSTITIKNGSKGTSGANGTNGTSAAWFTGTVVTGTSTTVTSFTVSGSKAGDMYLNTSTYNVYRASAANSWVYVCNIKGATGAKGNTGTNGTNGTTPTIKSANGSNISSVGTPSVTASTSGTTTTFTFNYLKGATGATGTRGTVLSLGTAITGTSTTATIFSSSGLASSLVNDVYLNTSTFNMYKCTVAGNAATAKWVYVGCIKGATGSKGDAGTNATTTAVATTSVNGLMSSADKIKLNYTNIAYATCVTAAATAAKVATISGNSNWTLQVGSIVVVKYTYTNTASSCTLNVNSTGAKSFWYNNAKYTGNSDMVCGYANKCIVYMYDGTNWIWITHGADNNTTYSNMTAATSNTAGKAGLVPAPAAGAQGKYLRGDGTWQTPPDTNTTYSVATQSANGLLSAADKKKLDGITSGANTKFISLTQTEYDNLKTKESNVIYFITDAD